LQKVMMVSLSILFISYGGLDHDVIACFVCASLYPCEQQKMWMY